MTVFLFNTMFRENCGFIKHEDSKKPILAKRRKKKENLVCIIKI